MSGEAVFETLGCRLNSYETEAMTRLASDAGVGDVAVVNSCAVTSEAGRQTRQRIRRLRRQYPGRQIVVTGCAAQTDPDLYAAMPEVDLVLGNREKMDPSTWRAMDSGGRDGDPASGSETGHGANADTGPTVSSRIRVGDIMADHPLSVPRVDGLGARSRAYVQVQNGCDHRCTFCIIPYGRGNSRSVAAAEVVDQVAHLTDRGFREVVLTGVDLTAWGADLPGQQRLGDLVVCILDRVPALPRLRLSSIDSIEADPVLIEAMGSETRLMPHLHLSLQSGDDLILKRMKRRHSRRDAIRFCDAIRRRRPDVVLGADIIAGFPTEDEAMFGNSLDLLEDCGLTWLHVFPFSPRPGTPAARMPQVPRAVVKTRAGRLRDRAADRVTAYLDSQEGRRHAVLMEDGRTGRTEGFAEVRLDADCRPGKIVEIEVTGRRDRRLTGRLAAPGPGRRQDGPGADACRA